MKLHSICEIRNKRYFIRENFLIFRKFIEKITIHYENHVYSAVTLHLSPLITFGPPIRVDSIRDASFTYLRILFQHTHTHTQKKIVFTKIGENQGRSLSITPPLFGLPIRGVLVLVVP